MTGNGTDKLQAGNGNNLVIARSGLQASTPCRSGNGDNILIDGSVALTGSGDSLRQVLAERLGEASAAPPRPPVHSFRGWR